jgi:hypothetical protein
VYIESPRCYETTTLNSQKTSLAHIILQSEAEDLRAVNPYDLRHDTLYEDVLNAKGAGYDVTNHRELHPSR